MSQDLTRINFNNIVTKSSLIPPFSLAQFSSAFPFSSSPFLPRIFLPFRNVNFSIFRSGSIISRSSTSVEDINISFDWLRSIIEPFKLMLSESYEILNITSSVTLAPPLNLLSLSSYLPCCSYDPSPPLNENGLEHYVDAIVFYFNPECKPRGTALIFPSGKATLTGFCSFSALIRDVLRLSSLLLKIVQDHPAVLGDLNDR